MTTLYKLDSKGKMRMLQISTEGSKLVQVSGLVDGGKVTNYSECVGKNIGRSNETTPEQQAILEADSKIKEKLKEGYFETIDEAKGSTVVLPMLALDIKKLKKPIDWGNCYVQPKLDGMRCLGNSDKMISRTNTLIDTMPHIQDELANLATSIFCDGELYEHGKTFQENMELIKKYRGKDSENVKYHVYDMVIPLPFTERYRMLSKVIFGSKHIELVPTFKVTSMEEVNKYHVQFLFEGYEGTIIRWGNEGYEPDKRSMHLLKKKDFIDKACKVLDIIPSEKRPEQGIAVCEMNDKIFKATPKMSHAGKEELLLNKSSYIGRTAEIRFFEYTDDGFPRFPVLVGFRLDK